MADTETETTVETETTELPPEQETRIVDKVVDKVKGVIKEIVGEPAAAETETEEVVEETATEPTTARAQESEMEGLVRAELAKIGMAEEQAKVNDHVKKEMERPPRQLGRVTQALWGDRD